MVLPKKVLLSVGIGLPAICSAQTPALFMSPTSEVGPAGAIVSARILAPAGAPFAIFVDTDGGPVDVLGERFYLGLTPGFATLLGGLVPPTGSAGTSVTIAPFPGLVGQTVYGQGVTLDASAPNGRFRVSNGASTSIYAGFSAIVETFDAGTLAGYTGSFASTVPGYIGGGVVELRTIDTMLEQGLPLPPVVASPLVPYGCRTQLIYRASDIGANGRAEVITAMRWRAAAPVVAEAYPSFDLRVGHSDVVPDYTIDPFSALPQAPESGLAPIFTENERVGEPPQVVHEGTYSISPATQLGDGFVPFPMSKNFEYDGVSSLLIEFRVGQEPTAGGNRIAHRLLVPSSPLPGARVFDLGVPAQPVNPDQSTQGTVDSLMPELQIDFARARTDARSPWLDSGQYKPAYGDAIVARSLPAGTSVELEFRGSASSLGAHPTAWSSDPSIADGMQFLQFRITFHANAVTGEVPQIDTVVVPVL